MRREQINGITVPYNKSIDELELMLSTGNMSNFVVACEALSYKTDEKSFELLNNYATDKDKNKRLCILKTIFRHPYAIQLKDFLEQSILSDDIWFAESGLKNVYEYNFQIPDEIILSATYKHIKNLYGGSLYALKKLNENETNYLKLVDLFNQLEISSQKEILGDILCEKYLPEKAEEMFELFAKDNFSKIRLLAVKIGKKYGFDISEFYTDLDGHVKKESMKK